MARTVHQSDLRRTLIDHVKRIRILESRPMPGGTVIVNGETVVFPHQSGYWYLPQFTNYGASGSSQGVGIFQVMPIYVPTDTTYDRIGFRKNSGAGVTNLARLGLYENVTTGIAYPGALIGDYGTVDGSGAGGTQKDITISEALTSGLYWTACAYQGVFGMSINGFTNIQWINQTHTSLATLHAGANPATYETTGITGALPDPFPAFGTATFVGSGVVGAVGLRAA